MPSNTTTDQPTLAVTQADREEAADLLLAIDHLASSGADWVRRGHVDGGPTVQAFARHRTNSEPRPAGDLREAVVRIERFVSLMLPQVPMTTRRNCEADIVRMANDFADLRAALATHSPAPMAGWRDMNDAPKDGSHILAWFWSTLVGSYGWADTIRWWNGRWWDDRDGPCEPAAWMPRPAPPVAHPSTQEG